MTSHPLAVKLESNRTKPMGRIIPFSEMTDKQLLEKANTYGIQADVGETLRFFGRAEAERILDSHMKNNPTRRKAIRKSHCDRIKKERGTKCECCQKADWTQICHIEPPIPGDSTSGRKENDRLLRQSNYSLIQELLEKVWLGCKKCHANFDSVWSKEHGRNKDSLERYFQHIRQGKKSVTRRAQQRASKAAENNTLIDKLYDRNMCQCCQQTKKTELAHIYGKVGKVNSVSNILGDSNERCLNEAKKCVPMCHDCHNNDYDKKHSATGTQNPMTWEQTCRDKIEELNLGLEGHQRLDKWVQEMGQRLAEVVWTPCELEGPIERPKHPRAKDYSLGTKDPSYKKDRSKYRTASERWKCQDIPGYRESRNAKSKARNAKKRAEDKWC